MPSRVDKSPFVVGENVAITPGKVVWKNEMMELIQYTPITEEVREIPFLNIPPQINKFYASDSGSDYQHRSVLAERRLPDLHYLLAQSNQGTQGLGPV